ncbi:unnamed protein product [Mytilus coruscus]|uniref:Tc1-like transposase DDE domain-containing protein n=1 Tax=Mytilus coruscus TaxID=42192 RepID=A0A6J8B232_MYTCO|nr:unnamed protein product [Mytilus coruscus]
MAPKRKELSLSEKNAIAALHKAGVKGPDFARQTGHPISTIYGVLNRFKGTKLWKIIGVIYSDECKVKIGMDNRVLVWRRPGEEWTPPCLNPGPGTSLSLMIWGCITYEGVGTITVVTGNINALKYIEIVGNFVWPVIARHFPGDNYIYQDDNAPVHRAKVVKEYMEQNQLYGMEWPVQSPDLSIIENMWRKIKLQLQKQAHNITTKAQMDTANRNIWTNIPLEFIKKLYESIPRRLRQVIRASGLRFVGNLLSVRKSEIAFNNETYSSVVISMPANTVIKVNHITENVLFGVTVYGFGPYEAYGFSAGLRI